MGDKILFVEAKSIVELNIFKGMELCSKQEESPLIQNWLQITKIKIE